MSVRGGRCDVRAGRPLRLVGLPACQTGRMRALFVLGKPAHRSPVIAEVMENLGDRGVSVGAVVPRAVTDDDGAWLVDDQLQRVGTQLGEAQLVAQRGLAPRVLRLLEPWAQRCCNDPVATALTHRRVDLLEVLGRAGVPVPSFDLVQDYDTARHHGGVLKAIDARAGRGAGVLLAGQAPHGPPFPGPYLVQQHLQGWEAKVYLFGDQVRAARRPAGHQRGGEPYAPSAEHTAVARAAADAVGLDLCGVDLIITADGPVVIDLNAFPSATKIPGAARLIADHLADHLAGQVASRPVGPPRPG